VTSYPKPHFKTFVKSILFFAELISIGGGDSDIGGGPAREAESLRVARAA